MVHKPIHRHPATLHPQKPNVQPGNDKTLKAILLLTITIKSTSTVTSTITGTITITISSIITLISW